MTGSLADRTAKKPEESPVTIRLPSHPDHADVTPKEALELARDVLAAMPESEIHRNPGLDPSAAAGIVIGSLPRIDKHRDEAVAQFGDDAAIVFDDLGIIAKATEQATTELAASDSSSDLGEMHEEIADDHALLLGDGDALANRKLIERSRVDPGRPCNGYRTTLESVFVLIALFREHWPVIEGKTPLTLDDLIAIEKRADLMRRRLNEREQGSSRLPAAELRTRALSLLLRTYGEVRRMITFVRWWADDADAIAPSLWSRRGKVRSPIGGEVTDPQPVPPMPGVPNNGGGPFTS